jgi:hypothetical protein
MPFDQGAIRDRGWRLGFNNCSTVSVKSVEHQRLDLGSRHARDAAGLLLSMLQQRVRDIVPVAHSELVGVGRAHAVAAVVEDAPGQDGGSALEPKNEACRQRGRPAGPILVSTLPEKALCRQRREMWASTSVSPCAYLQGTVWAGASARGRSPLLLADARHAAVEVRRVEQTIVLDDGARNPM